MISLEMSGLRSISGRLRGLVHSMEADMRRPTLSEWKVIRETFDAAMAAPEATRLDRLRELTHDAYVRQEVLSLLAAYDQAERFLEPGAAETDLPQGGSLDAGVRVGPFRIERLLGRGGMGEVYLARRADGQFDQTVALKLLRPEASTRAALFEEERRILAGLEHPGIARLIDGGLADDGRAWMAMEFVDGIDLLSWRRREGLGLGASLRVFAEVCDAVAYAHRRLVIHRDIKPDNIRITTEGRPRLLDFGVARLAGAAGEDGHAPVTPEYAAPEQLEGLEPTTTVDVHALGVVLYELLTDRSPWGGGAMPGVLRRVLFDQPAPPSSNTAPGAPAKSEQLRGDLDAIILKAMNPDPALRYGGVGDLAEDIRRHLDFMPVEARGADRSYVVGRFLRRHRWAAGGAAAAVLAIMIGGAAFAWQAQRATIERDVARAEARRAQAVRDYVMLMFRNAGEQGGGEATAKDILDASAENLLNSFDGMDQERGEVLYALGELYALLHDDAAAVSLLTRYLDRAGVSADPVERARAQAQLAGIQARNGKTDEASGLLDLALPVLERDTFRNRVLLLETISTRAMILRQQGNADEAIALLAQGVERSIDILGEAHMDTLAVLQNLIVHNILAARIDEAEEALNRADAIVARNPGAAPLMLLTFAQMRAAIADKRGNVDAAAEGHLHVATLRRELFGPSMALAMDLNQLGRMRLKQGRPAEAISLMEEALELGLEYGEPSAAPVLVLRTGVADSWLALGEPGRAEAVLLPFESDFAGLPPSHPYAGLLHQVAGHIRMKQGRRAEALERLHAADRIFTPMGPAGAQFLEMSERIRSGRTPGRVQDSASSR